VILDVFDVDERDALQEVVNIGMGTAGAALSAALESLVGLSVPKIDLVRLNRFSDIPRLVGWSDPDACAIRQAFYDGIDGEVIVLFGHEGRARLSEKLGYTDEDTGASEQELLLDFTNVFVGACMNGIARQLALQLRYSAPSILSLNTPLSTTLEQLEVAVDSLLLVNVDFALQDCSFRSQLVILFPNASTIRLKEAVAQFVAAL
jgi:chemotaxis protein CheC